MKKSKKINVLVAVSLLLSLIINVQNVWAESYTVNRVSVDGGNVSNPSTNPIVANDGSWGVLPGEYFKVSSGGNFVGYAYCADPGSATPNGQMDVVDMGGDEYQKAFDYICNQIGDNTPGAQEVSYLKAYSVNSSFASCSDGVGKSTCDGYKALMNGGAKWNTSYGDFDIKTAVNDAIAAETSSAVVKPYFTINGNSLVLNATVPGTLKVSNPGGYAIKVNGQSYEEKKYSEGTYTITIDTTDCDSTKEISFTFEYEENLVSQEYVAKRLSSTTNQSTQDLIFCTPNTSTCENGVCTATEKLTPTCEPNVCEDPNPEISTPGFDDNGNAICDGNGNTIIEVDESPSGLDAEKSEIACIADEKHDATSAILGSDNDYCNIYCTEDIKLTLPGPDFRNVDELGNPLDKEVFVNAGSYFEITGPLTQTDEITCYGEMHFEKFEEDVRTLRKNVVKAYNKWQYQQAIADNKLIKNQETSTYIDEEGNSKTENSLCRVYADYNALKMTADGNIVSTTPLDAGAEFEASYLVPYSGQNCSDAVNLPNTATEARTAYNTAVTNANTKIPEAEEKWKSCTTWNFDDLETTIETKEKNCYTDITFSYDDGAVDVNLESIDFNSGSTGSIASGSGTTQINVGVCDSNGSNCNKYNSGYDVSKSFINHSATINIEYKFDNGFAIDYETNAIYKGSDAEECIAAGNCSDMIYGFPIDIDTPQGIGTYQYEYSGIGHNWNDMAIGVCSMGRFDGDIEDYDTYMCYYNVNSCEDCEVECDGEGCDLNIPECDGEGCKVACVGGGCILDINAGFLATFRTISLNDEEFAEVALLSASPNTLLAYNSSEEFGESNWDNEKGRNASAEISDKGESIYGGEPEYSITLTPIVINDIKGYNKDNEDNGGYLNDTLTCTRNKDNNEDYGKCTSSFVTDYITKNSSEIFEVYPGNWQDESFVGPAWK